MTDIRACPVCGSDRAELILERPNAPLHGELLVPEEAIAAATAPLAIAGCPGCGFIFNAADEPPTIPSPVLAESILATIRTPRGVNSDAVSVLNLVVEAGVRDARIAAIGPGISRLLRKLLEYEEGSRAVLFDPAAEANAVELNGRLRIVKSALVHGHAPLFKDGPANVVLCRGALETAAEPLDLLYAFHSWIAGADEPRIFVEAVSSEWALANRDYSALSLDRCSYFTHAALTGALRTAGFQVKEENPAKPADDGTLRLEATVASSNRASSGAAVRWREIAAATADDAAKVFSLAKEFALSEDRVRRQLAVQAPEWKQRGSVAFWSGSARQCAVAGILDPEGKSIDLVVDRGPLPPAIRLPGSGIPVITSEQLAERGAGTILVAGDAFTNAIVRQFKSLRIDAQIVDLRTLDIP